MAIKGQPITLAYTAIDTVLNVGKTGDAANHTLRIIKDGVAAVPTNTPAEVDAVNTPGEYSIALTGAEANYDTIKVAGKSSTSGVLIIPVSVVTERGDLATGFAAGAKESTLATVASYIDTEIQTLIDRIGAFTGTGVNTVLGFFKALMRKDLAAPSDVGGTFDPATDSTEALAEKEAATYAALLALGDLPQTAHVYTAGEKIVVPQGDVMNLPFSLGSAHDCTGKRLYFYAWDNATKALFIDKLECTLTDALNVIGTVPLTAAHLAELRSCTYEYVRFDADGTSNKHTVVQGPMVIGDSLAV